jgi:hypothetical protein
MNKKFVYQVGNYKKVILWCTANQISRSVWKLKGISFRFLKTDFHWIVHTNWIPTTQTTVCSHYTNYIIQYRNTTLFILKTVQNPEVRCVTDSIMLMSTAVVTHSYHWAINRWIVSIQSFGKIRNGWKVFKCNAGKRCKRSAGSILWEINSYYIESRILQTVKGWKANWIGHILSKKNLLKLVIEER